MRNFSKILFDIFSIPVGKILRPDPNCVNSGLLNCSALLTHHPECPLYSKNLAQVLQDQGLHRACRGCSHFPRGGGRLRSEHNIWRHLFQVPVCTVFLQERPLLFLAHSQQVARAEDKPQGGIALFPSIDQV